MPADQKLSEISVLIVDCQATAATPGKGWLFEFAWATGDGAIDSTLVQLPTGEKMPRRVTQLTGVRSADLESAPGFASATERFTTSTGWQETLFVAHFARYERPWFEHMLGTPVEWICTHEIAKRVLPGLPRKGLKAVAGYLGRPLHDAKRASEHVEATQFVWRELVDLLSEEGIETLDELWRWLELPPKKTDERLYPLARETRLGLPRQPGVYRMLNRNGRVLYVGKATSLKDRVNSYFRQRRLANDKMELVAQVWDLDVTVTESALEAALLETDEIKRLAPPYNHALQAEGREVMWCSRSDFRDVSGVPSARHVLGPFSSRHTMEHFADVVDFVNGAERMPWLNSASPEVLDAARQTFRDTHGIELLDVSTMVELGRALHPLPDSTDEEDGPSVTVVTEDSALRMLEWTVVCAYRAVARGAWMRRLASSCVRWAPHGAPDQRREITLASKFEDVDAYDRVSVLLTELRRILRDGREVAVCDSTGVEFDASQLADELGRF